MFDDLAKRGVARVCQHKRSFLLTRSSADADNGLDVFVGQSRSKNILNPFQVK